MRALTMSVIVLTSVVAGVASGQQTTLPGGIPLNQALPQLPPAPDPANRLPKQSHQPCANARQEVPTGDATVATSASRTPEGIGLYGGEGSDETTASSADSRTPCPPLH